MKCCDISAGKLRNKISIQRKTRTPDGGGGWSDTWAEIHNISAYIKPVSGNEVFVAMRIQASITHDIMIRYLDDVKASDRIVFKERLFNIQSVINIEERNRWLQMRCEEGVAV
jgi:SPP1 family predicted phage head-tail adaptor